MPIYGIMSGRSGLCLFATLGPVEAVPGSGSVEQELMECITNMCMEISSCRAFAYLIIFWDWLVDPLGPQFSVSFVQLNFSRDVSCTVSV